MPEFNLGNAPLYVPEYNPEIALIAPEPERVFQELDFAMHGAYLPEGAEGAGEKSFTVDLLRKGNKFIFIGTDGHQYCFTSEDASQIRPFLNWLGVTPEQQYNFFKYYSQSYLRGHIENFINLALTLAPNVAANRSYTCVLESGSIDNIDIDAISKISGLDNELITNEITLAKTKNFSLEHLAQRIQGLTVEKYFGIKYREKYFSYVAAISVIDFSKGKDIIIQTRAVYREKNDSGEFLPTAVTASETKITNYGVEVPPKVWASPFAQACMNLETTQVQETELEELLAKERASNAAAAENYQQKYRQNQQKLKQIQINPLTGKTQTEVTLHHTPIVFERDIDIALRELAPVLDDVLLPTMNPLPVPMKAQTISNLLVGIELFFADFKSEKLKIMLGQEQFDWHDFAIWYSSNPNRQNSIEFGALTEVNQLGLFKAFLSAKGINEEQLRYYQRINDKENIRFLDKISDCQAEIATAFICYFSDSGPAKLQAQSQIQIAGIIDGKPVQYYIPGMICSSYTLGEPIVQTEMGYSNSLLEKIVTNQTIPNTFENLVKASNQVKISENKERFVINSESAVFAGSLNDQVLTYKLDIPEQQNAELTVYAKGKNCVFFPALLNASLFNDILQDFPRGVESNQHKSICGQTYSDFQAYAVENGLSQDATQEEVKQIFISWLPTLGLTEDDYQPLGYAYIQDLNDLMGQAMSKAFVIKSGEQFKVNAKKTNLKFEKHDEQLFFVSECEDYVIISNLPDGSTKETRLPGTTKVIGKVTPKGCEIISQNASNTLLARLSTEKGTFLGIDDTLIAEALREESEKSAHSQEDFNPSAQNLIDWYLKPLQRLETIPLVAAYIPFGLNQITPDNFNINLFIALRNRIEAIEKSYFEIHRRTDFFQPSETNLQLTWAKNCLDAFATALMHNPQLVRDFRHPTEEQLKALSPWAGVMKDLDRLEEFLNDKHKVFNLDEVALKLLTDFLAPRRQLPLESRCNALVQQLKEVEKSKESYEKITNPIHKFIHDDELFQNADNNVRNARERIKDALFDFELPSLLDLVIVKQYVSTVKPLRDENTNQEIVANKNLHVYFDKCISEIYLTNDAEVLIKYPRDESLHSCLKKLSPDKYSENFTTNSLEHGTGVKINDKSILDIKTALKADEIKIPSPSFRARLRNIFIEPVTQVPVINGVTDEHKQLALFSDTLADVSKLTDIDRSKLNNANLKFALRTYSLQALKRIYLDNANSSFAFIRKSKLYQSLIHANDWSFQNAWKTQEVQQLFGLHKDIVIALMKSNIEVAFFFMKNAEARKQVGLGNIDFQEMYNRWQEAEDIGVKANFVGYKNRQQFVDLLVSKKMYKGWSDPTDADFETKHIQKSWLGLVKKIKPVIDTSADVSYLIRDRRFQDIQAMSLEEIIESCDPHALYLLFSTLTKGKAGKELQGIDFKDFLTKVTALTFENTLPLQNTQSKSVCHLAAAIRNNKYIALAVAEYVKKQFEAAKDPNIKSEYLQLLVKIACADRSGEVAKMILETSLWQRIRNKHPLSAENLTDIVVAHQGNDEVLNLIVKQSRFGYRHADKIKDQVAVLNLETRIHSAKAKSKLAEVDITLVYEEVAANQNPLAINDLIAKPEPDVATQINYQLSQKEYEELIDALAKMAQIPEMIPGTLYAKAAAEAQFRKEFVLSRIQSGAVPSVVSVVISPQAASLSVVQEDDLESSSEDTEVSGDSVDYTAIKSNLENEEPVKLLAALNKAIHEGQIADIKTILNAEGVLDKLFTLYDKKLGQNQLVSIANAISIIETEEARKPFLCKLTIEQVKQIFDDTVDAKRFCTLCKNFSMLEFFQLNPNLGKDIYDFRPRILDSLYSENETEISIAWSGFIENISKNDEALDKANVAQRAFIVAASKLSLEKEKSPTPILDSNPVPIHT